MPSRLTAPGMLFACILIVIYFLGSYAAFHTNYTWDTEQEQKILYANLDAVSGMIHGNRAGSRALLDSSDKYYGIGFHAPAYWIQRALHKPVAAVLRVDRYAAFLLTKQWLVFSTFFLSGGIVFLLSRMIIGDGMFARLVMLSYLLWPYLFGQSLVDVKDVPFLVAWLGCTWLSLVVANSMIKRRRIRLVSILCLAILSGWLISIRVTGILISIQYVVTLALVWRYREDRGAPIVVAAGRIALPSLAFLIVLATFVFISYPVFWIDPLHAWHAVAFMSHHPTGLWIPTLTLGKLVYGGGLPAFYIPAWLIVKLPSIVLVGICAAPFAAYRLDRRLEAGSACTFNTLLLTSLGLPTLLVMTHVVLYNELRQVLFLMPLYFIVGILSLGILSRPIARAGLIMTIGLFAIDNLAAFPYQYIWFNEVARQFSPEKYFVTDYWGLSAKNLTAQLPHLYHGAMPECIFADSDIIYRGGVAEGICLKNLDNAVAPSPRPFVAMSYTREGVISYLDNSCTVIGAENVRLFLANGDLLGTIPLSQIHLCK